MTALSFFATVPRGLESLLAGELRTLGAERVKQVRAGVMFAGSLETAYRACLWSRLAGRILLPVTAGASADGDELYKTASAVDWSVHLGVDGTLAVDFTGVNERIRDTRYGAVRIKDAMVDQFRAAHDGRRPSVDARAPDVRVNAHLTGGRVTISIDLSGQSLHRRGYRADRVQVEAPLKENLAAAVLLYAAWPLEATAGGSLIDPLCGSGTLPIEAGLMAADIAPGLLRAARLSAPAAGAPAFGFLRWRGHDAGLWERLIDEAHRRRDAGLDGLKAADPGIVIRGADRDTRAVSIARDCVERAGLTGVVSIEQAELESAAPPAVRGLLATNAPYGERLTDDADTEAVYRLLGERLRDAFGGWSAAVLAGERRQAAAVGLAAKREIELRNGPLTCLLTYFEAGAARTPDAPRSARAAVRSAKPNAGPAAGPSAGGPAQTPTPPADAPATPAGPSAGARSADASAEAIGAPPGARPTTSASPPAAPARATTLASPPAAKSAAPGRGATSRPGALGGGAEYLANRLLKNRRRLARRLQREGITCYRLYDADMPEYNVVVDVYGDRAHVQEYAAPPEIDPAKTQRRLTEALDVIGAVLDLPSDHIVLKQRRRQRGTAQYQRRAESSALLPVSEDELTYLIDLDTYLDTGFFIDQRMTRRMVRRLAGGRRFLNLFAYTGVMTVNALAGGSPVSTTVDLSATYLDWAQRNLKANGLEATREVWPPAHRPGDAPGSTQSGEGPGTPAPAVRTSATAPHNLIQADCLRWIGEAGGQYDLIWLDPPTFSNSKRMGRATFDVQRDHIDLLRLTARRLLAPGGILLFATNLRNFSLDRDGLLPALDVKDISRATLAFDCERSANRHHVFRIERR